MASRSSEFPRYIYVPWIDGVPHGGRADETVELAQVVARETGLPVLGVAATTQQLPDDWGRRPYRTSKSRAHSVAGPAVEVYFWPTVDLLASMPPTHGEHTFVLEWGSDDLSGWARHAGAVDFDEKQTMVPTITAEALELYAAIDWNGNNSWRDAPGKRDALRDLRKLKAMGELDPLDLAGYMIGRHGEHAIKNLLELARKVGGSHSRSTL
jgi:hypothetical protein